MTAAKRQAFLNSLTPKLLQQLPFMFELWALEHQRPPAGSWRTWVILGGRGAGKTRAGAEWVRAQVEGVTPLAQGRARRVAIVGETFDQARDVMVFGESGLLAISPPHCRPKWSSTRRQLVWPNGAEAQVYSAFDPDALRGAQFDALWADELAKWKRGFEAWDMLQFALRLGDDPRACVTTTPRNVEILHKLLERDSTVMTQATTFANRANLADGFLEEVQARYAGTQLGKQELDGVLLGDVEGALWSQDHFQKAQGEIPKEFSRIVVSVDPAVSHHKGSDECGIVVAGVVATGPVGSWRAYVLEDATLKASHPSQWAQAAVDLFHRYQADRLVAEVNQGGSMVEAVIRQIDPAVSYKSVHARRGKIARAEPISALYEQGRVIHARGLQKLEAQMGQMTLQGYQGQGSPDRVDALVWALHELIIEPSLAWKAPQIRGL